MAYHLGARLRAALQIFAARQSSSPSDVVHVGPPLFQNVEAGTHVNPYNALQVSTVWRCVHYIAQTIASLPVHVRQQVDERTFVRQVNHPVERLLNLRPNPEMTSVDYFGAKIASALLWGGSVSEIERNLANTPRNLWYLMPDRISLHRAQDPDDSLNRPVIYRHSGSATTTDFFAPEVLHLRNIAYDGIVGYSTIAWAARDLGLSIAAAQFGSTFFGNGSMPSAVLKTKRRVGPEGKKRLRKNIEEFLRGPRKSNRFLLLDEDKDFQPVTIPPEEAQFLETRLIDPESGQRCEGNSACTPICPVQAKYNANKTLNALPRAKL